MKDIQEAWGPFLSGTHEETHTKILCVCPDCAAVFERWFESDLVESELEMLQSTTDCTSCEDAAIEDESEEESFPSTPAYTPPRVALNGVSVHREVPPRRHRKWKSEEESFPLTKEEIKDLSPYAYHIIWNDGHD